MRIVDRTIGAYEGAVAWARKHSRIFDHVWRAKTRFNDALGTRLAAAISYYGFFAVFSLGLLGYSILRRLPRGQTGAVATINNYLEENLPWIQSASLQTNAATLTAIGAVSLVLTGIGWVEALRSSQRQVWLLDQHPGNPVIRRLVDLAMLVGLGLLLGLSLAIATAIDRLLDWIAGPNTTIVGDTVLRSSGPVLEFGVNVVLAAALLAAVPRLRLSPRRLIPTALVVAVGVQLLNTVGRLVIARTERNPAYQVVAGSVGLLIYLFLFNQLILYGAALAATANRGSMVDLAAGPPSPRENDRSPPAPEPAHNVGEPPGNPRSHPP